MAIYRVDRFTTPGPRCFTMPAGFHPEVEVHVWGAGGGTSGGGAAGGGGGYAKSVVNMLEGDIIELSVGTAGGHATADHSGLGGLGYIGTRFSGGHGGERGVHHPGGGGGGASMVYVNRPSNNTETLVAVGAGGGGGSNNITTKARFYGYAAGILSNWFTWSWGERASALGGGGGGGGQQGGKANAQTGGSGGKNYASNGVVAAGTNNLAGGKTTPYYPGGSAGDAGFNGAVVLVFRRKMQMWIKDAIWKRLDAMKYKVGGVWKNVEDVYIKQNGKWVPIVATTTPPYKTEQVFTKVGTFNWTCPPGITQIKVKVYGGGAGGALGGGGAGGVATGFVAVTPGQTYTYTVGAGGAVSQAGGQSSFGSVIANGGGTNGATGGAGGTATGGSISNVTGQSGKSGYIVYYWYGWSYWGFGSYYNSFGGYVYNRNWWY